MRAEQNILKNLDWATIIIWFVMVMAGWLTIYAACYDYEHTRIFDMSMRYGQQLVWIAVASVFAILLIAIDTKFYGSIAIPLYVLMIGLLILTIFVAPEVKGSHSWIQIGGFRFQPAELAKYATALCLAKYMSSYGYNIKNSKNFLVTALIIGLPMLIIIAQQETGSALVFAVFILVLFREGLDGDFLIYGALAILFFVLVIKFNNIPLPPDAPIVEHYGYMIVFIIAVLTGIFLIFHYTGDIPMFNVYAITNASIWVLGIILKLIKADLLSYTLISEVSFAASALLFFIYAIIRRSRVHLRVILFFILTAGLCFAADYAFNNVLQPHQQIRIKVVMGLEDDPQGAGYNVRQAQIAIGSGGLTGKGFLNGTQTKLNYVPEQDTDFIFCTIGEETGFLGTTFIVLLYVVFISRLVYLAERQRTPFSRIYGYSVASIFFFHFCINIGMVIGLLPVIGIPLPFFSYGGSSMIAFTILLFTFIKLDTRHTETMAT
ncbi:MAG: rod shape-determining protein RodA [Paludibacteraceae bacterium]|nr:rod shape-determining protein RodA [Paludibacteraceae bacterium]